MRRLFIVRKDLHMSPGKLATQIASCAEDYWVRWMFREQNLCYDNGQNVVAISAAVSPDTADYANSALIKTICEAYNKNHLLRATIVAEDLGLKRYEDYDFVYDSCITELRPQEEDGTTLTSIWFRPLPDEIVHQISCEYHLYTG